tara:strand:+ start:499 stop:660 length:162 start_codon:yes stop_codon:yes gene_type:complete
LVSLGFVGNEEIAELIIYKLVYKATNKSRTAVNIVKHALNIKENLSFISNLQN